MKRIVNKLLTLSIVAMSLVTVTIGFLFLNDSVAWLAHSDSVAADDMSVSVRTTPNIIIGKSEAELLGETLHFSVSFEEDGVSNMIAATHDDTAADTYLKHLVSHYAVDHETGNAKDGTSLDFEPVPLVSDKVYFVDYTVYISSTSDSLGVSSLAARIVMPTSIDDDHPYFNAASIDFYVGEVSSEGYRGTTSVADSLKGGDRSSVELLPGGGTVPIASDGNIKVIMRCYFDGALQDAGTGHAYVNSNTVKTDGIDISVSFTAVDAKD
jgi:hypothetical protein